MTAAGDFFWFWLRLYLDAAAFLCVDFGFAATTALTLFTLNPLVSSTAGWQSQDCGRLHDRRDDQAKLNGNAKCERFVHQRLPKLELAL